MTRSRLRIRSEARLEIDAAFEWYFERSPVAANAFLLELRTALEWIAAHPKLHPPFTRNTRKKSLKRFPYAVVFREKKNAILVIAVAHAKRRPGYWSKRL